MKPGNRVFVYYCPDRERLSIHEGLIGEGREDESYDESAETMTSFEFHEGVVVSAKSKVYEMEGDYNWELCVALDTEVEEKRARTFRKDDKVPNLWHEGPYYGGYDASAVIVRK